MLRKFSFILFTLGLWSSLFAVIPVPLRSLYSFSNDRMDQEIDQTPFMSETFIGDEMFLRSLPIEDVLEKSLSSGYATQLSVGQLEWARIDTMRQAMSITPRLELDFSLEKLDVGVSSSLKSLFKGFVPSEWFNLSAKLEHYLTQKYKLAHTLYNQFNVVQISYMGTHRRERELVIYQHYINFLKRLIQDAEGVKNSNLVNVEGKPLIDGEDLEFLRSYITRLEGEAEITKLHWDKERHNLAYLMALGKEKKKESLNFKLTSLPLPTVDDIPNLFYRSEREDDLIKEMIKRSVELDAIDSAYREKLATFWAVSLDFIKTLAISLGADQYFKSQLVSIELEEIKVEFYKMKGELIRQMQDSFSQYHTAVDLLTVSEEGKARYNKLLKETLQRYLKREQGLDGFYRYIKYGLQAELQRNYAQHLFLMSKADIDRRLCVAKPFIKEIIKKYHLKREL